MTDKLLIHASSGGEDAERASLPWIFGNKALLAGQEVSIMLTMEAVRLVTEGGADGIQHAGHPPLPDLIREFVGGGGTVWACETCTKPRGITDVVDGAEIRGAVTVVEYLASGAASLTF
jgi:predicted peroxiredoxin